MAFRGHISGFDFATLHALFGSRDGSAMKAVADIVMSELSGDSEDEEDQEEAQNILALCRRAIFEGVPFPELPPEEEVHASAAFFLSRVGQSHYHTTFSGWMVLRVVPLFQSDYSTELPPRER